MFFYRSLHKIIKYLHFPMYSIYFTTFLYLHSLSVFYFSFHAFFLCFQKTPVSSIFFLLLPLFFLTLPVLAAAPDKPPPFFFYHFNSILQVVNIHLLYEFSIRPLFLYPMANYLLIPLFMTSFFMIYLF